MTHKTMLFTLAIACLIPTISWGMNDNNNTPYEKAARDLLIANRDELQQKGIVFDDQLLQMKLQCPADFIDALNQFSILNEKNQSLMPITAALQNESIKAVLILGAQEIPLELLEALEFLANEANKFGNNIDVDQKKQTQELTHCFYDIFHKAAESKRTFFGQFARLTMSGKVTVGIGAIFAGLGVLKTIEWLQGDTHSDEREREQYIY